MNDSADEPPLSHRLRSWASTNLNPFRAGHSHSGPASPDDHILPRHVRNDPPSAGAPPTTDSLQHEKNTDQQATSVVDKKGEGAQPTSIGTKPTKLPLGTRILSDVKYIMFCSWINWLLIFVPVGIVLGALVKANPDHPAVSPSVVFAVNAVAIIPLASLLSFATESVAVKMGDTIGALLNVTFGNAVELIIFIIALVAKEIRILQAALLGSILSNLLLILGMCFVFGGLRFREQLYNPTVSQMSACLLSLSVISLLLPTAFHASFNDVDTANRLVLKVSRGTSVVLLLVYVIYLLFQLKSHAYMYESTPQHLIDEESHPGILADMLNSSSSSSDTSSSSSSDSESSSGSHTTAKRIKRALRRKRRKSVSSSKDSTSTPSFKRTPSSTTNNTTFTHAQSESPAAMSPSPKLSQYFEPVFSGDEADTDDHGKHRAPSQTTGVTARDFETDKGRPESSKEKLKKKMKKAKKAKKAKKQKAIAEESEDNPGKTGDQIAPLTVEVAFADDVQDIPDATAAGKRPFNIRNISTGVRPVIPKNLASTVFVHHQMTGRSLPVPQPRLTPVPRQSTGTLRRTSSLPENLHRTTSVPTSAQPLPHLMPANQPQANVEAKDIVEEKRHLSRTSAVILLLFSTGLVAICAEFLVDSINYLVESSGVSQAFVGLIILPIVGNAAEHVTAVTVAAKNKMDLAINVALGSSIQIALFVTPVIVLLGWILKTDMSLYFSLFETISLFASAFIVSYLVIDGRSNYLEGVLLIAAYVIIAVAAFFYPSCGLSVASGATDSSRASC